MDERSDKGWHSDDTPGGFRDQKGSGAGATTGGRKGSAGAGDYGGGRGTDHDRPTAQDPTEQEEQARQGPIADEHMREGWGGEGEPYASAQGLNHRDQGETRQDRKFRDGPPPPASTEAQARASGLPPKGLGSTT